MVQHGVVRRGEHTVVVHDSRGRVDAADRVRRRRVEDDLLELPRELRRHGQQCRGIRVHLVLVQRLLGLLRDLDGGRHIGRPVRHVCAVGIVAQIVPLAAALLERGAVLPAQIVHRARPRGVRKARVVGGAQLRVALVVRRQRRAVREAFAGAGDLDVVHERPLAVRRGVELVRDAPPVVHHKLEPVRAGREVERTQEGRVGPQLAQRNLAAPLVSKRASDVHLAPLTAPHEVDGRERRLLVGRRIARGHRVAGRRMGRRVLPPDGRRRRRGRRARGHLTLCTRGLGDTRAREQRRLGLCAADGCPRLAAGVVRGRRGGDDRTLGRRAAVHGHVQNIERLERTRRGRGRVIPRCALRSARKLARDRRGDAQIRRQRRQPAAAGRLRTARRLVRSRLAVEDGGRRHIVRRRRRLLVDDQRRAVGNVDAAAHKALVARDGRALWVGESCIARARRVGRLQLDRRLRRGLECALDVVVSGIGQDRREAVRGLRASTRRIAVLGIAVDRVGRRAPVCAVAALNARVGERALRAVHARVTRRTARIGHAGQHYTGLLAVVPAAVWVPAHGCELLVIARRCPVGGQVDAVRIEVPGSVHGDGRVGRDAAGRGRRKVAARRVGIAQVGTHMRALRRALATPLRAGPLVRGRRVAHGQPGAVVDGAGVPPRMEACTLACAAMKVHLHKWHPVAYWRTSLAHTDWDVRDPDDVCGICQNYFDGVCGACRDPGDACPLGTSRRRSRSFWRVQPRIPLALHQQVALGKARAAVSHVQAAVGYVGTHLPSRRDPGEFQGHT